MLLYSIFDKVLGEYSAPIMASNDKVAKRWFKSTISKSDYEPVDFQLYKVGSFDTTTGEIGDTYEYIMNGADAIDPDVLGEK